ncbi:MAG: acyl-CoA dehydrogenase [Proteobacteria bacterium]|nr:MAG: acyl-CoA dehydrogenase [Pseudomonadota bacterium]
MAFSRQPMQPGLLYDTAARAAANKSFQDGQDPIGEMGWPLVLLAEHHGGLGGTLADLTSLVESLAAQGIAMPIIEQCAIAPLLLEAGGDTPWLGGLADGSMRFSPLVGSTSHDLTRHALLASSSEDSYLLQGEVRGVDATGKPTHWLAIGKLDADLAIFVLEASELPKPHSLHSGMDGRRTARYRMQEGVRIPRSRCLAQGKVAQEAIHRAGRAALAMVCADSVSVLGAMVEHTVEYLNGRIQFGVALSTFQALRHQLVNVYMRYESGRGMVMNYLADAGRDVEVDKRRLGLTKLVLGESARFSAETVIQLHGGMGMTEEMLVARLSQRLLANEFRYGDRFTHSALLALRH